MNLLEVIRRVVRQNTVNVGQPVTNIHGATAQVITGLETSVDTTWLRVTIPGNELVALSDFYAVYGADATNPFKLLPATAGILNYTESQSLVQLYRGVITLEQATSVEFSIALAGGTSKAALYVDGVLDRSDVERLTTTRILDAGQHMIEIMVVSPQVVITTPPNLKIDGTNDVMLPPSWAGISTGYTDPAGASTIITLQWNVDPRAGGWRVFRRQLTNLAAITSFSDAKAGRYSVTMNGNFETSLPAGNEIFVNDSSIGTVIITIYDSVTDSTSVSLQLPRALFVPNPGWSGKLATTGITSELIRIRRTTAAGLITYVDNSVTLGQAYYYVLQSYSLFDDTIVSPLSQTRMTVAGDTTAPASITFASGYPISTNRAVRVRFHTPSDADYSGVRVVFRRQLTGTVTAYSGTSLDVTVSGLIAGQAVGWNVRPTSGAGIRDEKIVTANTATNLTLNQTYESINAPVNGDTILLYIDQSMVTDHGVPNTDDELIFTASGYGVYQFRSFDLAGNEQNDGACLTWTFTQQLDNRTLGNGTQILSNPNFFGGLARYNVYDNGATGKVTLSIVADAIAPNPSGQVMRVSVASAAGSVTPGQGGFYVGIPEDGGTYKLDSYHKGATLIWIVRAKIPTNYQINFASNAIGSNGILGPWITPQVGTGGYFEYAYSETIGTAGSWSTTGHFYVSSIGTYDTLAFTWDVAQVACYDALRPTGDELPGLVCTPMESGNTGNVLVTLMDPRGRVTGTGSGVRFTTISGRNSAVVGSLISPGGVYSSATSPGDVALVEKLASYVDVDLFGIDSSGTYGALLDHKRVTFGLGNKPLPPEIGYTVDDLGNLFVNGLVDTDTTTVKAVASKAAQPTQAQVDAATAVTVSSGSGLVKIPIDAGSPLQPVPLLTGLNSGERYWIVMQAYNSALTPSDLSLLSDVYVAGSNSSIPNVSYISTAATDSSVKFTVKPNRHCAEFELYAKEYSTDPGADFAVDSAYPTPLDAIVVGPDVIRYRAQPETNFEVSVPISNGTNWIMLTVVPYDTLARQGTKLNKRGQGTGTAAPLRPTTAVASSVTSTTVTNNVTLATPRATGVKVYRDGALVSSVDVSASGNGAVVGFTDTGLNPGTTYSYAYSGYTVATGVESSDRTTPITGTTSSTPTIPQPLLNIANVSYDPNTETWSATVTPGSGSPAGVTWHLYRFTAATPLASFTERTGAASTSVNLTDYDPMDTSGGTDYWFAVKGTLSGWTTSLFSNPTTLGTEVSTGLVHKTGTGEPSATPTIGTATNPSTHTVRTTWTNTDTVSKIYIALERLVSGVWEAAAEVSNIAAGTTTFDKGVIVIGVYYRCRVRYYNSSHNGPWSSFAQTVSPIT
jgi:hypothetical protein